MLNEQLKELQKEAEQHAKAVKSAESAKPAESADAKPDEESGPAVSVETPPSVLTLTGTTNESVTLNISDLMYIEAVGNYVKVCTLRDGKVHSDMLRTTSKQIEDDLQAYPMIVRCHRSFLVNLHQVEQIVSNSNAKQLIIKHSHDAIPVSRSNMPAVKEAIKKA